MDNREQIKEIEKYCYYLTILTRKNVNIEQAAQIWIRKYAHIWRSYHSETNSKQQELSIQTY